MNKKRMDSEGDDALPLRPPGSGESGKTPWEETKWLRKFGPIGAIIAALLLIYFAKASGPSSFSTDMKRLYQQPGALAVAQAGQLPLLPWERVNRSGGFSEEGYRDASVLFGAGLLDGHNLLAGKTAEKAVPEFLTVERWQTPVLGKEKTPTTDYYWLGRWAMGGWATCDDQQPLEATEQAALLVVHDNIKAMFLERHEDQLATRIMANFPPKPVRLGDDPGASMGVCQQYRADIENLITFLGPEA